MRVPYYEMEPDAVYSAAQAAYGTSSDWHSWSTSSESALVDASTTAQESRLAAAFQTYLSGVQPTLTSLPILAANQGTLTAQAVNVVSDAQTESLAIYSGEYSSGQDACSSLVRQAAASFQNGEATKQAYQPAVTSWTGSCAPDVGAANTPVQSSSAAASSSLAWAAVVTQYWGTQVEAFNAKVDHIVVPISNPPAGQTPEQAQLVLQQAQTDWWDAYDTYIESGGDRAAAMLRDGPTEKNIGIAQSAGVLPGSPRYGVGRHLAERCGSRHAADGPGLAGLDPVGDRPARVRSGHRCRLDDEDPDRPVRTPQRPRQVRLARRPHMVAASGRRR